MADDEAEAAHLAEEAAARAAEAEAARQAAADFAAENSIGSLFIGARATLGRNNLKDVERDLRIKARYLEAIEAIDPDALPLDAYLPGYVKAYARYLERELPLSPDAAYEKFRAELDAKLAALGRPRQADAARPSGGAATLGPAETAARAVPSGAASARAPQDVARTLDPLGAVRAAAEARENRPAPAAVSPAEARRAASRMAKKIARARAQARKQAARSEQGAEPWLSRLAPFGALLAAGAVLLGLSAGVWSLLSSAQRIGFDDGAAQDGALRVIERRDPTAPAGGVERPSAAAYEEGGALTTLYAPDAQPAPSAAGPSRQEAQPVGPQPDILPPAPDTASPVAAVDADALPAVTPPPAVAPPAPAAQGPAFGVLALEEAWTRVRDSQGRTLLSRVLGPGELAPLPADAGALQIRTGNAGGLALIAGGRVYGPFGEAGAVREAWVTPEQAARDLPALDTVTP